MFYISDTVSACVFTCFRSAALSLQDAVGECPHASRGWDNPPCVDAEHVDEQSIKPNQDLDLIDHEVDLGNLEGHLLRPRETSETS